MSAADLAASLKLRRSGRQWRGACPVHGGTKDPFALAEGVDGALLVFCHAGCERIAILAEIRRLGLLADPEQKPGVEISTSAAKASAAPLDWSPRAEHLWQQTESLIGTPVETYLRARRCALPRSDEIRYLAPGPLGPYPVMVARVTDVFTAAPISLHFTRLAPDGSGKATVEKPKLLLTGHRKSGGCIRLSRDEDVTLCLGLTEGIETGLAVMAAGWSPVWAAIDAGNLSSFPVPAGVETLTIWADNDESMTGQKSAADCAARWRSAGRETAIMLPPASGQDWNDIARAS